MKWFRQSPVLTSVGTIGALCTCSGSMVAFLSGLLGAAGTAGGAMAMGHGAMMGMGAVQENPILGFLRAYSWPIFGLTILALVWGMRQAPRTAKIWIMFGMAFLTADQVLMTIRHHMIFGLYMLALICLLVGTVVSWASRGRQAFSIPQQIEG